MLSWQRMVDELMRSLETAGFSKSVQEKVRFGKLPVEVMQQIVDSHLLASKPSGFLVDKAQAGLPQPETEKDSPLQEWFREVSRCLDAADGLSPRARSHYLALCISSQEASVSRRFLGEWNKRFALVHGDEGTTYERRPHKDEAGLRAAPRSPNRDGVQSAEEQDIPEEQDHLWRMG